eukprot:363582-Chlamydomonas_euryale.AAC.4
MLQNTNLLSFLFRVAACLPGRVHAETLEQNRQLSARLLGSPGLMPSSSLHSSASSAPDLAAASRAAGPTLKPPSRLAAATGSKQPLPKHTDEHADAQAGAGGADAPGAAEQGGHGSDDSTASAAAPAPALASLPCEDDAPAGPNVQAWRVASLAAASEAASGVNPSGPRGPSGTGLGASAARLGASTTAGTGASASGLTFQRLRAAHPQLMSSMSRSSRVRLADSRLGSVLEPLLRRTDDALREGSDGDALQDADAAFEELRMLSVWEKLLLSVTAGGSGDWAEASAGTQTFRCARTRVQPAPPWPCHGPR